MVLVVFILAGCWDERLYKENSVVSLVGFEGEIGKINAYYSYPVTIADENKIIIIEAEGKTPKDARTNAEMRMEQGLDVSLMSALLLGVDPAKDGLLKYLDLYWREPRSSISALLLIVEGSPKQYMEASQSWTDKPGAYFSRLFESSEVFSIIKNYTLQTAGSILFAEGSDLALPYLKMEEDEQRPEIGGLALFSKDKFTGKIIDAKESVYLVLLSQDKGKEARLSFVYNDIPLSITINQVNKNWEVESSNSISLNYEMDVQIDEYAESGLRDVRKISELESFLNKEIQESMTKIVEILQEEKSDAIGIGRFVRMSHFEMFEKENWGDTFSQLDLEVTVATKILKVGIIH